MKILLIIPPMTQINNPYPSTAYLSGYLKSIGHEVAQVDLGLELFLSLFSKNGLEEIFEVLKKKNSKANKNSEKEKYFIEASEDYISTIDDVVYFLQGKNPSLALRISKRNFLPEGPRFVTLDQYPELLNSFGEMGIQDKAKYLASLYLDDLSDLISGSIDSEFGFSRYGESLASSMESFSPLYEKLNSHQTIIRTKLENLTRKLIIKENPDVVGFSIPFPGNVFGALISAKLIKEEFQNKKIVAGGGYVNTELREIADTRFFEFIDFLVLDDGEGPLKNLLEYLAGKTSIDHLIRTKFIKDKKLISSKLSGPDVPFKNIKPSFAGLNLKNYTAMLEMPNPMHRMWSDFRWNKLIMAHGCYWKKCTFCDVSLDYINRYEPQSIEGLIENIKAIISETGQSGFHFVDEALPPALVKKFCEKLIEENLKITWWGNLRFDKNFEPIAALMSEAGCVAVTGGLEVASPRILAMIDKGITVPQVAKVTKSFSQNQIYVHSYLMYGFPSQTVQETVDSLEVVRQMFKAECLHSAYWHRFMCTAHSPVGLNPQKYQIKIHPIKIPKEGLFAKNTVAFTDSINVDHDGLGIGLKKAIYNYMHGIGLDEDVRAWFEMDVPKTTINKKFIEKSLS